MAWRLKQPKELPEVSDMEDDQFADASPPKRQRSKENTGASAASSTGGGGKGKARAQAGAKTTKNSGSLTQADRTLQAVIPLLLIHSSAISELKSCVVDTFIIDSNSRVVKQIKVALNEYTKKCKEGGKGHNLGPPTPYAWDALISSLCESGEGALTPDNRAALLTHNQDLSKVDISHLMDSIRVCKVSKMFDKGKKRLELAYYLDPTSSYQAMRDFVAKDMQEVTPPLACIRGEVAKALVALGAVKRVGPAPKGYLERKLQETLASLEQQ
eukprot:TRINITY_DN15733_c0_g1_i3.p2 TRINITY_DN15733_c0_g1~~TRINITY_DN15733_c0_g1_i3.p2  ORF type:complete len:271 (-),score=66.40 TRINITY_DN15733_c0_g1_i3:120-932(-)